MADYSKELIDALKGIVFDCNWQNVGKASSFKQMTCYKLYCLDGVDEDILLVKDKREEFYAIDSRCSHESGPLEQGDIEELADKLVVICPWHSFDFDLSNGESSTGLKQQTYQVRVVDDNVYVNTPNELSLIKSKPDELKNEQTKYLNAQIESLNLNSDDSNKNSLTYWAAKILQTPNPKEKCDLTEKVAKMWFENEITLIGNVLPPDEPKRLDSLNIVDPGKIRRGKGGTLASRIALLHSLANIEQWAIDLSWDIIARFCNSQFPDQSKIPKDFIDDFIKVALDEAKHFNLLEKRLIELGSHFGVLPVHNGLWESATATKDNFLARLAIVHMVHEARGLDVHPQTRLRFGNQNDFDSVKLLDILYKDEIRHVAAGLKWFQYSCKKYNYDFIETFHDMVKNFFKGYLKPPFDTEGRNTAGFSEQWYMPLIKPEKKIKIEKKNFIILLTVNPENNLC